MDEVDDGWHVAEVLEDSDERAVVLRDIDIGVLLNKHNQGSEPYQLRILVKLSAGAEHRSKDVRRRHCSQSLRP